MTSTEDIRSRAEAFTDEPAPLGDPIPVIDTAGNLSSWFVPHLHGDRLVGFVELTADLRHRRTSSFRRRRDTTEGCPLARSWLDPQAVVQRARRELRRGERTGEAALSFDQIPDRLAWAVSVAGGPTPTTVYVAGEEAWRGKGATGLGP